MRDIAGDALACAAVLRLGLAVALALLFVPAGPRADADTRNRALIVLDASKSMNEDAGNGGTRLDAAKQAVDALVDRLPAGAPLGHARVRLEGREASRAEGCADTELTCPVGPLDKDGAARHASTALTGKGRTPIGASLLAVPDDLGPAEGRRSVVLVSDGGDNCAPPAPCKAAERGRQARRRAVDLASSASRSTSASAASCAASRSVGGGSYVDVDDAGRLGEELSALLARAFRAYEPAGTEVEGGPSPATGALLGAGLYQDEHRAPGDARRWFAVDVPAGGARSSRVTAIPPPDSSGRRLFVSKLCRTAGAPEDWIAFATRTSTARGSRHRRGRAAARACGLAAGRSAGPLRAAHGDLRGGGRVRRAGGPDRDRGAVRRAGRRGRASCATPGKLPTPTPTRDARAAATPAGVIRRRGPGGARRVAGRARGPGRAGSRSGSLASKVLLRRAAA